MTREEATEVLKLYLFDEDEKIAEDVKKFDEALRMAIEALSEPINCVKCAHYTETEDGDGVKGRCRKDGEEIIRDILKTIPTVYRHLLDGVSTVEELMEEPRPQGEWIPHATSIGNTHAQTAEQI